MDVEFEKFINKSDIDKINYLIDTFIEQLDTNENINISAIFDLVYYIKDNDININKLSNIQLRKLRRIVRHLVIASNEIFTNINKLIHDKLNNNERSKFENMDKNELIDYILNNK